MIVLAVNLRVHYTNTKARPAHTGGELRVLINVGAGLQEGGRERMKIIHYIPVAVFRSYNTIV